MNPHNPFVPSVHTLLDDLNHLIGPLFLVGGTVRNMLQQKAFSTELNVIVRLPLSECQRRLQQNGHDCVSKCKKHNSLLVPLKDHGRTRVIEIATFRHRQNREATVDEDLFHRDLTINAIAYSWPQGPIIDPFSGCKDLAEGRIRFVDGRDTVKEDALRALRFFRYTMQLNGQPDAQDLELAEKTVTNLVSREKVRAELDQIFSLPLDDSKQVPLILRFFHSPLVQDVFVDMESEPICAEEGRLPQRWERAIGMVLELTSPDKEEEVPLLDLRWAALFHEIGELSCISLEKGTIRTAHQHVANQKIGTILQKFHFSQRRQKRIQSLLYHIDGNLQPNDRVVSRLMLHGTPLQGLFRLIHAREVANLREVDASRPWGKSKKREKAGSSSRLAHGDSRRTRGSEKEVLDQQLAKILERCRLMHQASRQPSPQDLAISGGEILDLVRRPQGAWMRDVLTELLEWVNQDPSRNRRSRLHRRVREWVAKQEIA